MPSCPPSGLLRQADDPATALPLVDEAIDLGGTLGRNGSGAYAEGLAKNWLVQYLCLVDLARYEDAATAAFEAFEAVDRSPGARGTTVVRGHPDLGPLR
ncbi:hypothetical protein [Streptomyces sp. I05A-00742]|uniref:hypothetical protein n=1 Tax=Streptomyces sp. I05A-00742 TaxID=2732853 RepID=UPI00148771EC|nr:hypothetical protein [Streptomyces sp. I05A-00742]